MTTTRILIVGAGALGLTTGYHLQLAGAEISFLVRPHRVMELSRPQQLYRYNDHGLKTLQDYHIISDTAELQDRQFDFVLLTLDGASCRSDQGVATLKALGSALTGTAAKLMINGVGIGLYEHVRQTTGLPDTALMQGTMGIFAYQVGRPNAPRPASIDEALHDKADIAFLNFPNGIDFLVAAKPKQASREFMTLFNRCGVASCRRFPVVLFSMFSNSFFPFTTACEINGWQGTESLIADNELWHLCCSSRREIMGLKRFGVLGKVFSFIMSDAQQAKMMRNSDRDAEAMGFTAFNKFHHGGKVLEQDIQIMENCLAAGESQGRDMSATRKLLARWHQLHQPSAVQS